MTYLAAAIAVLKASKRPMTIEEITTVATRKGLILPSGKTPNATMSARLYLYTRDTRSPEIRRQFRVGRQRAARNSVRWVYVG